MESRFTKDYRRMVLDMANVYRIPSSRCQQAGGNMGLEISKEATAGAIHLEGIAV